MASEYINQWIRIEEDGIYLVFGVTKENQLKLFHFSAKPLSEQEEKKLRELGMEEEKIQKLRQMDREDFLEERRYREHLDETMQDMNSIKEKDSALFARDVKELLDHIGDKRIYELLKETEHQTLEILLLSTWGYSGREVAKIMGMAEQTIYTKRNRLRKKLKNLSKIE